jgi:PAS domain S-box-containing protein
MPIRLTQPAAAGFEATTVGMVVVGLDGSILSISPSWAAKLGYAESELQGCPVRQVLAPDETIEPSSSQNGTTTESGRRTLRYRHKDGVDLPSDTLVVAVPGTESVLLVSEPANPRRQLERGLQQSEWRFRTLVEHSPDIVVVVGADRSIAYVNPAVTRVLGYPPGEAIGAALDDFVHAEDLPRPESDWPMLLSQYESLLKAEIRVRHRDGSWRVFEVVAHNLLHNPVIAGVVVYGRDVTGRAEASRKLREFAIETDERQAAAIGMLQRALAGRGKESLVRLLGEELLNPIGGMGAFAELLLTTQLDSAQRECALKIRDSAHTLSSAIRQFVESATNS